MLNLVIFAHLILRAFTLSSFQSFSVQLSHRVPYITLSSLCQNLQDSIGYIDSKVLLDTGSSQFWLADNYCSSCSMTKSYCPHLFFSEITINYVNWNVYGSYSLIKICRKRVKFLCVRGSQNMKNLDGEGILGLKSSQGFSLLFESNIENEEKSDNSFKAITLYYGQKQHEVYLISWSNSKINKIDYFLQQKAHHFNQQQNSPSISLQCSKDWQLQISQILLEGNQKVYQSKDENKMIVSVDSGSSDIILPWTLCSSILAVLNREHVRKCFYWAVAETGAGIYCDNSLQQFSLSFRQQNTIFEISSAQLVNKMYNKIDIICQNCENCGNNRIILGYPFFKKYQITFLKDQQNSQNHLILQKSDSTRIQQERNNLKIIFLCYVTVCYILAWICVKVISYFQDKRQKKIII